MPPSFLSYIAWQHGLKFEDVATDALAYILSNSISARSTFAQLLNSWASVLPEYYWINQRSSTAGSGVPDLVLADEKDISRVVIEAKFTARLTSHQQGNYLSLLRKSLENGESAMLAFLVPKSRMAHYQTKLREAYSTSEVCWESNHDGKARLFIRILNWQEVLIAFDKAERGRELDVFLKDLKRMCSVAEPDMFQELTEEEIAAIAEPNGNLAARLRNFMILASELAKETLKEHRKRSSLDDAWGPSWSGIYGKIAGEEAWIGVDTSAWSEHGVSPIWLEIDAGNRVSLFEKQLTTMGKDVGYFIRNNGNQIAIPIRLTRGSRDDVLENGCKQIDAVGARLALLAECRI